MIDRTDLQLMLLENVFEMGTDELIDLFEQITGNEMKIVDLETEEMLGSVESLEISDPRQLKRMLGFFLYVLGERVKMPVED